MKLIEVRIKLFRNILDSTPVPIERDVTCLVGKNESGKTAFLHALYRLNPARPNVSFDVPTQYPAWLEKKDRHSGMELEKVRPVCAIFELEDDDRELVDQRFGHNALNSNRLTLEREYGGQLIYTLDINEQNIVSFTVAQAELPTDIVHDASQVTSFGELSSFIESLKTSSNERPEIKPAVDSLEMNVREKLGSSNCRDAIINLLKERIPKFFYFADYSSLPSRFKIRELLLRNEDDLNDDEHTALSLLRLAATDNDYLLTPDYERRKRELENIANAITTEILKYWTQNSELRVLIDISQETVSLPQGKQSVLDELKVRMWDERHWLSLPFDEHSSGFRWFFSFLVAFSKYEWEETPVVILLDEPALGLHARAQKDFLRFIDERLAPKHQVIHTTHSPFMIEPGKLGRVRVVEDRGREEGVKITVDVLSTDPDTLFPLQGTIGYDLAQHLFIAPNNLVVEGTSDFTYLRVMSDYLKEKGITYLDDRWSIVPVGGADLIPTFVALLGHHLDVTVLVDSRKGGNQKLSRLADEGYLAHKRIITIGEILGQKLSDIEDVFTIEDYLKLYNHAFSTNIKPSDLSGTDPIVSRISRQQGIDEFDHGRPAEVLLRRRDELLPQLSQNTLERFGKLFERINATLRIES